MRPRPAVYAKRGLKMSNSRLVATRFIGASWWYALGIRFQVSPSRGEVSPSHMTTTFLLDVCETHLDEAEWFWTRWEHALAAPDYDLADTAEVEERLLAHVDGLSEGGPPVVEALLRPALESEELARVSAAFLAFLQSHPPAEEVRAWVCDTVPAQHSAMRRVLEVCDWEGVGTALLPLLEGTDTELQALVLDALVFREELPDEVLADFLPHEDPRMRMAAMRGLRTLPRTNARALLSSALASVNPVIRDAAIEWGLAVGSQEAWAVCRQAVKQQGRESLVLWAMGADEEDVALLVDLLRIPERRAGALWALGFSGRVTAAEACLEWMEDAQVSRLAGEAFSSITGLSMDGPHALPPEPPLEEPIPLEMENLDADLTPRPEDDLPRPDAEAVAAWWRGARGRFVRGTRYWLGQPFQGELLLTALERGPMRRRHVWARELEIRSRRACRVESRALTRRQRVELKRAASMGIRLPGASFARLLTG
ncbi:MAG TPA: TIGR02270 family protein [Archangium sp.]|uniref:TIGR02270 family protein n=1 Tax=Archangium sp. TaxID=1872627 RepID=UPI002E35DA61|nr:TIGR02270 family protein [Archangium sp.]HEX5751194.1 TIGR02270 family protein [Archangium sp.]